MPITKPQMFLDNLQIELYKLSDSQRIFFGRLVCERHLPEYEQFSRLFEWGDPELLKDAISFAELQRIAITKNRSKAEDLLKACIEATPDAGDFETVLVDYAQDSAIMVCHLIQYLIEQNITSIASIASRARDLVDAKIQSEEELDPSDPELERKIAASPLMQSELFALDRLLNEAHTAN